MRSADNMDNAPPDPKRQRISSVTPDQWSNGQHVRSLPPPPLQTQGPPPPPPSHAYSSQHPPYSRPGSGPPPPPQPQHHMSLDDRRHPSESEYGHLPHEAQRPMPGAAPNPYPGYNGPIRDPSFKREDVDPNSSHQHSRPHSTGHNTDPHMAPYAGEDPRRQSMSYEGMPTAPQGVPPPPYRSYTQQGPPGPVGPPQLQTQMPPNPDPYYSPTPIYPNGVASYNQSPHAGNQTQPQRRKAPRTSQACGQCRTAKAKCDDPKPCSACRKAGLVCDFKPPEPKQADKVQQEMAEGISALVSQNTEILNRLDRVERQLSNRDTDVVHIYNDDHAAGGASGMVEDELKEEAAYDRSLSQIADTPGPPNREQRPFYAEEATSDDNADDEIEAANIIYPKAAPAIPENHTTPASRMLSWPSIVSMLGDFIANDPKIKNHHYTTTREVKRGVLRLYGRGEATSESQRVLEKEPMPDQVGDAMADDGASEASASPAADYLWGQTGSFTPPTSLHVITKMSDERRGGLDTTNSALDLTESTVRVLAESYMNNINIMHPIISPGRLARLIANFLKEIPGPEPSKKDMAPSFIGVGGKRKRAEGDVGSPPAPHLKPGRPQRSIDSALMLVILALGKICQHRQPIPNVVPDVDQDLGYGGMKNGHPSPSNFSPGISPQSSLPSPKDKESKLPGMRRNSMDSNLPSNLRRNDVRPQPLRNLDVIPGLAYFAAATDLIGNQLGGNTLRHVQVNIMASLYHGQLARVAESHAYIAAACRALQVILLGKSERFRALVEREQMGSPKDTPILMAFWTCLQLESDIAAELDFPQSGILRWENVMPWPNGADIRAMGISPTQVNSYMAQLFTRKHLNKIHKNQYESGREDDYRLPIDPDKFKILLNHIRDSETLLRGVSSSLRPVVGAPEEPEVMNILLERLEAKKYGALNITYRPCLMMIMNRPKDFPFSQIPQEIRNYASLCLSAMEHSTAAFPMKHGERVIITNPWGTAHAQWGNVIALQAAYMDPDLRQLIDKQKLIKLINKTLDFLTNIAQPSSSLAQDIKILEYMAVKVTKLIPNYRNAGPGSGTSSQQLVGAGSFGSGASSEMSPA